MKQTTTKDIIKLLRQQASYLQQSFGVKALGLFGSYAKDKATKESDIDLYIEFDKKSFRTVAKTYNYLQQLIDRKIDLITPHKGANKHIIEHIKSETIWIIKPKSS